MYKKIKHWIPFAILILLILLVYVSNFHELFTLDRIRLEQQKVLSFVHAHPILSPIIFISFYTLSVSLIIPDSTILTLLGGLVFPLPLAFTYSVFSETIGATIFFAVFHGVFGTSLIQRERPFFYKMRKGFHRHEINYLLFLRLSHILPFWLINVCAAYFKVRYWTFIWTCLIGVIPLTVVLTEAGNKLSKLFAENTALTLSDIFTTQMKLILLAIGLMFLFPIEYKNIKKRKK